MKSLLLFTVIKSHKRYYMNNKAPYYQRVIYKYAYVKKQQESERGNVQVVCFRQEPEEDVFCALLFGFNLRPHTRYWADGSD